MRILIAALLLAAATPALSDETKGEILAFDRQAKIIVMTDKTIWPLPAALEVPGDLAHGDLVHIDFTSDGDNGVISVDKITRLGS